MGGEAGERVEIWWGRFEKVVEWWRLMRKVVEWVGEVRMGWRGREGLGREWEGGGML